MDPKEHPKGSRPDRPKSPHSDHGKGHHADSHKGVSIDHHSKGHHSDPRGYHGDHHKDHQKAHHHVHSRSPHTHSPHAQYKDHHADTHVHHREHHSRERHSPGPHSRDHSPKSFHPDHSKGPEPHQRDRKSCKGRSEEKGNREFEDHAVNTDRNISSVNSSEFSVVSMEFVTDSSGSMKEKPKSGGIPKDLCKQLEECTKDVQNSVAKEPKGRPKELKDHQKEISTNVSTEQKYGVQDTRTDLGSKKDSVKDIESNRIKDVKERVREIESDLKTERRDTLTELGSDPVKTQRGSVKDITPQKDGPKDSKPQIIVESKDSSIVGKQPIREVKDKLELLTTNSKDDAKLFVRRTSSIEKKKMESDPHQELKEKMENIHFDLSLELKDRMKDIQEDLSKKQDIQDDVGKFCKKTYKESCGYA